MLVNLIPAFPLDGGRIFRAMLWDAISNLRHATMIATGVGQLIALSIMFYGSMRGFWQLRSGIVGEGLGIAIAGWIIHRAITQCEQQTVLHDRDLLSGYTVRSAMQAGCPRVLRCLTLDIVMAQIILPSKHGYVLVVTDHQLDGLLSAGRIATIPQKRWSITRVEDVMLPLSKLKAVHPEVTLATALVRMAAENECQFVVVDDHQPLGVIARESVLRFLDGQAGSPSGLVAAHA